MHGFVAYYRVSTQRQGAAGLGLQAQRTAVAAHIRAAGGRLIDEFEEIESGAHSRRPELEAAIARARTERASLVIAKLDRLARNVHFISQLMESGVEFVAADLPHANKLTIHIIAAVAEYERDLISKRTAAALARAKSNGTRLGNPNAARQAKAASQRAKMNADLFAKSLHPHFSTMRAHGVTSLTDLANALNALKLPTQRGKRWTPKGVSNVIARMDSLAL